MDPERKTQAAASSAAGPISLPRICVRCRHHRVREASRLFQASELHTAGGLKAYGEWQQQEKQHAEREAQLVRDRQAFTYEPHHYAWCAAFTRLALVEKANAGDQAAFVELMNARAATVHPVSGKIAPIYALCLYNNANGECEVYEPREL